MIRRKACLTEIVSLKTGKLDSNAAIPDGAYPFFTCSQQTLRINEPAFDTEAVLLGGNNAIGIFPLKYYNGQFNAYQRTYVIESLDPNVLNTRYLYYALRPALSHFQSASIGAATQYLTKGILDNFQVLLPFISEQNRIVSILSAYDDLIENNRRRIQLLEQSARLIYKEWFVHLRFPGHEHVNITDGIPEGWERAPINSFCIVGRGGSPRPINHYLDGTVPWFKIGDATASESPFVFSTKELIIENGVRKSVYLPAHELILSNSATCGVPYFTGVSGCIHDGWLYFKKLTRVTKWFLYCCLFEKQREILMGIGEGATQKNLNIDYIGRQLVLLPKETCLLEAFTDTIKTIFQQILTLAQVNINLSKARDLLLPRLMNGEISV
jgi:type I restriction enzyme, S subunit